MLSIIIPTLNEEKSLPALLSSIKEQEFENYEIIVADAGSKDDTLKLAKKYDCRIVDGGLPAVGRNNGAKIAKGDYLLFLDADVILPKDFLKITINKFKNKNLDISSCLMTPLSSKKIDFILHNVVNIYLMITQYFYPHAPGFCILVKKDLHNVIKGFNEKIKLAEDHDYANRAGRSGKFRISYSPKIFVSVRRLETDGRFNISMKYLFAEIYRMTIGEIKSDIFNYKLKHHYENTRE